MKHYKKSEEEGLGKSSQKNASRNFQDFRQKEREIDSNLKSKWFEMELSENRRKISHYSMQRTSF